MTNDLTLYLAIGGHFVFVTSCFTSHLVIVFWFPLGTILCYQLTKVWIMNMIDKTSRSDIKLFSVESPLEWKGEENKNIGRACVGWDDHVTALRGTFYVFSIAIDQLHFFILSFSQVFQGGLEYFLNFSMPLALNYFVKFSLLCNGRL